MNGFQYFSLGSAIFLGAVLLFHLVRLLRLGKPRDYSTATGKVAPAVLYSFTIGMSPVKKESAFLHLPTYTAGLSYHLGTFLSTGLWVVFWFSDIQDRNIIYSISIFLAITMACGWGILLKRLIKRELRGISNPDDYIANLLVTLFQIMTMLYLLFPFTQPGYYLVSGLLCLYFPLGKLKHALYFFAARYHLGFFFGRRGVWPPQTLKHLQP